MKIRFKYLFLVLFLFLFSAGNNDLFAQTDDKNLLRFDGLYRTDRIGKDNTKSYSYFRFCENGTVTGISTPFDEKRVSKWLVCEPGKQKYSVGKYTINNNKISFTTKNENGEVDYEGVIDKKAVVLNVFSRINNNSDQNRKYKFVSVSFSEN